MSLAIASRYARALADAVGGGGDYRKVAQELDHFAAVFAASAELREVLETPALTFAQKARVIKAVLKRLGSSALMWNFLRVLVSHYRLRMIDEVAKAFRKVANERMGIVEAQVAAAAPLDEDAQQALATRLRELIGHDVELQVKLDPQLLGGVSAQVGSTVYDGTVRGSLERIRQQLAASY